MGIEGTTMEFEPKMPPVALVEPQASVDYRRTREMTIDEILLCLLYTSPSPRDS